MADKKISRIYAGMKKKCNPVSACALSLSGDSNGNSYPAIPLTSTGSGPGPAFIWFTSLYAGVKSRLELIVCRDWYKLVSGHRHVPSNGTAVHGVAAAFVRCATFIILALALPALAFSDATTTVTGNLVGPDGRPANGLLYLSNPRFTTHEGTVVTAGTRQYKVSNGVVSIQLFPSDVSSPQFSYTCTYSWQGTSSETWLVPTSPSTVTISQIASTIPYVPIAGAVLPESSITGLIFDLYNRPIMASPPLANSRVVATDSSGNLVSVTGATAACVHVDGSTGSCGGAGSQTPWVQDVDGNGYQLLNIQGGTINTSFVGKSNGYAGVLQEFTWPSPRGTNTYAGIEMFIQDSLTDGSAGLSITNSGQGDAVFLEPRGLPTGQSTNPTGIGIKMNAIGLLQNNPQFNGAGIRIFDYTTALTNGVALEIRHPIGGNNLFINMVNDGDSATSMNMQAGKTGPQEINLFYSDYNGSGVWSLRKNGANHFQLLDVGRTGIPIDVTPGVTGVALEHLKLLDVTGVSNCLVADSSGNVSGSGAGGCFNPGAYTITTRTTNNPTNGYAIPTAMPSGGIAKISVASSIASFSAATFSDIVGLFGGGTCSGYLKSNGGCDTPAGSGGGGLCAPLITTTGGTIGVPTNCEIRTSASVPGTPAPANATVHPNADGTFRIGFDGGTYYAWYSSGSAPTCGAGITCVSAAAYPTDRPIYAINTFTVTGGTLTAASPADEALSQSKYTFQGAFVDRTVSAGEWIITPVPRVGQVRVVSGTSDTIQVGDCEGIVRYTAGSSIAVTVPAPGTGGNFTNGCWVSIIAVNSSLTMSSSGTFSPSGGASVGAGGFARITSDGSAIWTVEAGGTGGGGSGITQLVGDVTAGPGSGSQSTTVVAVNGTTIGTNAAADQVVVTTASATGAWKSVPNCVDSGGNHLNYTTATHAFSCGTTSSGGGGGGGTGGQVITFASTGTFTCPASGLYTAYGVGGGGGGGGGNFLGGFGGPGGGYAPPRDCTCTPAASVTVTIGAAGTGGSAGSNAGGNGGDTSISGCLVALGGKWSGSTLLPGYDNTNSSRAANSYFYMSDSGSLANYTVLGASPPSGSNRYIPLNASSELGGMGAAQQSSHDANGIAGNPSFEAGPGGGSGANSATTNTGGVGGIGKFGAGGVGGGVTSGSVTACTSGTAAGAGGGGGAYDQNGSSAVQAGCAGIKGRAVVILGN